MKKKKPTDTFFAKLIEYARVERNSEEKAVFLTGWHFVMDRLNTHMSEAAVKAVARVEGTTEKELGLKGVKPASSRI